MSKVLSKGTQVVLVADYDYSEHPLGNVLKELAKQEFVFEVRYLSIGMRYMVKYDDFLVSVPMEAVKSVNQIDHEQNDELNVAVFYEEDRIIRIVVTADRRRIAAIALGNKGGADIFVCDQELPGVFVYRDKPIEEEDELL